MLAAGKQQANAVFPIIFYTPETRMSLGGMLIHFFEEQNDANDGRVSNCKVTAIFTQNSQVILQFAPEIYLKDTGYVVDFQANYLDYPAQFYGIGRDTPETDVENYTRKDPMFDAKIRKLIGGHYSAGIIYQYREFNVSDIKAGGLLDSKTISGSTGGVSSAAGLQLMYDSRDNVFLPTRGAFCALTAGHAGKDFGGEFNYERYILDCRRYYYLLRPNVLALQFYFDMVNGAIPFQESPAIGGVNFMRGYYDGRFRDNCLALFQAEYRVPVHRLISLTFFGGAADVESDINEFRADRAKYSAGFGTRFSLNTEKKICVRTDIGFGENSSGFYVTMFEAF
ncbi:MAG: BamA/TamA family outer membrane protein [Elusimicrobiota bacterium]